MITEREYGGSRRGRSVRLPAAGDRSEDIDDPFPQDKRLGENIAMISSRAIVRLVWGMILLTSFIATPTKAARIDRQVTSPLSITISIDGEIVEGDGEALKLEIGRAETLKSTISEIQLNSIGGSLFEGANIARIIRNALLDTVVASGDTCASACFLAFAAGSTRTVHSGARVGVHAVSDEFGEQTQASRAGTAAMARIAKILGVPSAIVESMISTPSSQMFWLTAANLAAMGAVVTDKLHRPYWRRAD